MSRVFLSNVDDYLGPSQACVNPLFSTDKEKPSSTAEDASQNGNASTAPAIAATGTVISKPRRRRVHDARHHQPGGEPSIDAPRQQAAAAASRGSIVKATIADCLACSGCVTTAETVLLEEQHSLQALQELVRKPAPERPMLVLTISPASWADLLRHILPNNSIHENNLLNRQRQLTSLLQQTLHVSAVLDGNLPLQWALEESAREFCRAWTQQNNNRNNNSSTMAMMQVDPSQQEMLQQQLTPSRALSSTRTEYVLADPTMNTTETLILEDDGGHCPRAQQALPVIASSCPAVVCLVEKSFHRAVPHLATTKSPMSLAGAWWKQQQQQQPRSGLDTMFHVAVMPCYDKKLEASRKDFVSDATGQKDVDMVITTRECLELVQYALPEDSRDLQSELLAQPLSPVHSDVRDWMASLSSVPAATIKNQCCLIASSLQQQVGFNEILQASSLDNTFFASGSGGYAAYIFCHAAKELFGVSLTMQDLIWTPVNPAGMSEQRISARVASQQRRREYYEVVLYRDYSNGTYSLHNNNGWSSSSSFLQPVLRFAVAYGMQTIQRALQPFAEEGDFNFLSSASSTASHRFDYMEVMACPSGCVNGGGQIRLAERETPTETRQRVADTQALFQTSPPPSFLDPSSVSDATTNGDLIPVQNLHTRYHVVPPLQYAQGAVAGVAVKDMQF